MSPKVGSVKQRIIKAMSIRGCLSTVNWTMTIFAVSKSIPVHVSNADRPLRLIARRIVERTGANKERGLYLRKDAPPIQLLSTYFSAYKRPIRMRP